MLTNNCEFLQAKRAIFIFADRPQQMVNSSCTESFTVAV